MVRQFSSKRLSGKANRWEGEAPAEPETSTDLVLLWLGRSLALPFRTATKTSRHRCPAIGTTARPTGFTLLEVILAIALSATLLALITSALGLFLNQTNDGRHRVEQAQLARNLLRMVSEDLRNVAVYSPQDTAIAKQLAQSTGSFDVDLISGDGTGSGSSGDSSGGSGGGSGGGGDSSESQSTSTSSQYQQPLGVYGSLDELQIDVLQPARPLPMPASAEDQVGPVWRGGIRTVRYNVRDGDRPRGETIVVQRFDGTASAAFGGLVRGEIDRQQFDYAQQVGTADSFEQSSQVLAPEVIGIQFRYSDGLQSYDQWNSLTQQALPVAIEVRMWLENPADLPGESESRPSSRLTNATQYVMTIPVWRAALASTSDFSSSSSDSGSETGFGSGSSSGDAGSSDGSDSGSSNF